MEQFGERIEPSLIIRRFINIQKENDELVLAFNLRFVKTLSDVANNYRPNDSMCLVVYLAAFDEEMSYLLREKNLNSLW